MILFFKSLTKKQILIIIILFIFIFPSIILFFKNDNKKLIQDDMKLWLVKMKTEYFNDLYSLIFLLAFSRTFRSIYYFRLRGAPLFGKSILKGYDHFIIHKDTDIKGGGIFPYHPFSTIINAHSIGSNCTIRHLTTIGNKGSFEDGKPVILDNVDIGANATIIGNITIGNNVIIGAGAVITKSIPDNSTAVGNPMRILNKDRK